MPKRGKMNTREIMNRKLSCLVVAAFLVTAVGCGQFAVPEDYARIVVRNGSDSEPVTFEVTNAEGEVVLSEMLEPKASANARSTPGTHRAVATVAAAEGEVGATFDETFEVGVLAYVTYNSAGADTEAGLTIVAPKPHVPDDEGEVEPPAE
jgi:hypothetical protein